MNELVTIDEVKVEVADQVTEEIGVDVLEEITRPLTMRDLILEGEELVPNQHFNGWFAENYDSACVLGTALIAVRARLNKKL